MSYEPTVRGAVHHLAATFKHKGWVTWYLGKACAALMVRAVVHDWSKFGPTETIAFARVIHRLAGSTYGTPEYRAMLREIKPAIQHHYERNRHHPEYHDTLGKNGFARMSPIDLVEMLCDWKAASRRHDDGDIFKSIRVNAARFGYDENTVHGLTEMARELGF